MTSNHKLSIEYLVIFDDIVFNLKHFVKSDPTAKSRKADHIDLAFESNMIKHGHDDRFIYEPIMAGNTLDQVELSCSIAGQVMKAPLWVSSMTGGTEKAEFINKHLASACKKHGLGMGLGSCRSLIDNNDRFNDFNMRPYIGDQPLYANLGIAQIQELADRSAFDKITELIKRLEANGLIIHVNPLQEWTQPEGDKYVSAPIDLIKMVLDKLDCSIIVKEVGQGMGKKSIEALLKLPLTALDFAAYGGTNFAKLELLRGSSVRKENLSSIMFVGHTAEEMMTWTNEIANSIKVETENIIVSGGIKNFLDGHYFTKKSKLPALYGQASTFLKHTLKGEETLDEYISLQIEGLKMASRFLELKPTSK